MPEKAAAAEILAALPLALLVIDENGTVREVNSVAEAELNMSASSMIGRKLANVIQLPDHFHAPQDGPFAAFDVDFSAGRGRQLRGDIHITALGDHPGWRLLTIANARDHGLGSGLERRGGRRTAIAIAATLAHEIKNPLSGIRGAAQLLEGRVGESDAAMT